MDIRLHVPSKDKDKAQAKGAKFNPTINSWYTDDPSKLSEFKAWCVPHNIVCENLYLLRMKQQCWKCKKDTEVVLLATDKSYSKEENYRLNTDIQILTYVKQIPDVLKKYLDEKHKYYQSYSGTIKNAYFNNHCSKCGAMQGDNYLHEIPERAFYKKLFYKNSPPINYAQIKNRFCVLIDAQLPHYDRDSGSVSGIIRHMVSEVENRASLMVTQEKINGLFDCSIKDPDIVINGR